MEQALGDNLFTISIICLLVVWALGWLLLLPITLAQSLLPKYSGKLESFLQKTSKPLGMIGEYAGWLALFLFVVRAFSALLGWSQW